MNITPKNLNLSLKRTSHFDFLFFLGCFVLAAVVIKPNTLASWIVTLILVAPAFWFAFSGPAFLDKWATNHRYVFAEWLVFSIKLAIYFAITKLFAPVAVSLLSTWLHA